MQTAWKTALFSTWQSEAGRGRVALPHILKQLPLFRGLKTCTFSNSTPFTVRLKEL